jgi:MFS family permease
MEETQMAQMALAHEAQVPKNFRTVIMAAAGGNVIEWYDFYIFGSLATILSVKFFEKSHPVAALLSTIALFTAGFLVRPLGAFIFGWLGDRVGRKYTFIMTLVGMALGTGAIGLIPTFEQIGLSAAIILFCLRMLQGLCLGGSYGGAITYVAEHVADERRGYYTGWLQTSPTLGIVLSLIVIIATRTYAGEEAFNAWAWRIPFLFSFLLIFVTLYMRANFEESPVYLVFEPVLGAVLPADGVQGGHADQRLHRGNWFGHRHPVARLLRLVVRQDRPQACHPGRLPACGTDLLSALHLAWRGHTAR